MKKFFCIALSAILIALFSCVFACSCKGESANACTYDIECKLEGSTVVGRERVEFYNFTDNAFTEIKFNLYGNAFRKDATYKPINEKLNYKAYPNGVNYGDMQINSVKKGDENLEYAISGKDQNILVVSLKEELFPNESAVIDIDFNLNLANVIARTGVNDKTINLGNFYPILCGIEKGEFFECEYYNLGDPFYSDVANYTVKLTAPSEYVVASSGELIKESESGNLITSEYKIDNARSFSMVLSKEFEVLTKKVGNTTIKYYSYQDEFKEQNLDVIEKSLTFFNQKFGEYPYSTYSVVKTKFLEGGMEYPALTMISDEMQENQYKEVIVHETAHQWWQTVVGNNEIKQGFLDEGLTEYSVVLFYEEHKEFGFTRKDLIEIAEKNYKTFCTVYNKVFNNVNTKMDRALNEFTSEFEYVNMAYVKPCIMYDYFRTSVGDTKFFNGLKSYYNSYAFKNASIDDLIASFEKNGAGAKVFFEGFLNGTVII